MVSSICNGFMSSKDKKLSENNTKSTETEKKEIITVSIDTAEVNKANTQKVDFNNNRDTIIPADNNYNGDIITGLMGIETAVNRVEKAIIENSSSKKFFKPMFNTFGNFITNPFKSLAEVIKTNTQKTTDSFKNILNKIKTPFKFMSGFFGGKKVTQDDPIIEAQQEQKQKEADILVVRHKEIIEALVDIKKAIKGEDSFGGLGAVGLGAGVGLAVKGFFDKFKETFKTKAKGLGTTLGNFLKTAIKSPFGKFGALGIAGFIGTKIGEFINDSLLPDDVKRSIGDAIGPHIDKVVGFFSGISGFFKEKFEELDPAEVWANLKKGIVDSFSSIKEFFENPILAIKSAFSDDENEKPTYSSKRGRMNLRNKETKAKPIQKENIPLSKIENDLYNLNKLATGKNFENAQATEIENGQLESQKLNISIKAEAQKEMIQEQNKQNMKILKEQSKENSKNISITTGQKGRSLDNSPIATTDVGLFLALGGGI